ncbi:MAG: hypothetical protein GXP43_01760 [bacterium]|nr:hypothetical protein [bacterium]
MAGKRKRVLLLFMLIGAVVGFLAVSGKKVFFEHGNIMAAAAGEDKVLATAGSSQDFKYGMDILGPAWQWVFPRTFIKRRFDNDQLNRVLNYRLNYDKLNDMYYGSAKAGVALNRLAIRPSFLKFPKRIYAPEWYWQDVDAAVNLSLAYNIEPVGYIFGSFCRDVAHVFSGCMEGTDKAAPPSDEWKTILRAVFRRYSSPGNEKIIYYEIWNEPDLDSYFLPNQPQTAKANEYLRLFKDAVEVRNEVNPNIKLLFGSLSDVYAVDFLREVFRNPQGKNLFNKAWALSAHAYGQHQGKMALIRNVLNDYDADQKPIWLTELNDTYNYNPGRSDDEPIIISPEWLRDLFTNLEQNYNVTKFFWFRAVDSQWGPGLFSKSGRGDAAVYYQNGFFYNSYKIAVNQNVYSGQKLDWRNYISEVSIGDANGNGRAFDRGDVICAIIKYLGLKNRRFVFRDQTKVFLYDTDVNYRFDRQDVINFIAWYLNSPSSASGGACLPLGAS